MLATVPHIVKKLASTPFPQKKLQGENDEEFLKISMDSNAPLAGNKGLGETDSPFYIHHLFRKKVFLSSTRDNFQDKYRVDKKNVYTIK